MDDRGRGAHGQQPALQAACQDQRGVRHDRAGARAARAREGEAGDRAVQSADRPSAASRRTTGSTWSPSRAIATSSRDYGVPTNVRSTWRRSCGLPGVVEDCRSADSVPTRTGPRSPGSSAKRSRELEAARAAEGRAMAAELIALAAASTAQLGLIAERGPQSSRTIRRRLAERVAALVQEQGVTVEPNDLIREVAILADRCDISEEIVRLRAHLAQFMRSSTRPRARAASSSSSARRWAARSTRSARRPAT